VRRLLLVTYHFPPEPAAGARRPAFLARHLPHFGWDVTVLTRPFGEPGAAPGNVIAAPVVGANLENAVRGALTTSGGASSAGNGGVSPARALLRTAKETLLFPDRAAPWLPGAISHGIAACRRQRFDAVLSTSMPASAHVAGAAIATACGLPWIADFRDLWTGNPTSHRKPARAAAEKILERALMRRASALVTISPALAERLEALHRRTVAVIPNAYDASEWSGMEAVEPNGFELCYTGSLYDGARSPALLFEALASLRAESDPAASVRVRFFGPNSDHVGELSRRFGVEDIVEQCGTVPREQALREQRLASTLLIFLNLDESTGHELGSKIIEYAGARRPVLAFGPRTSVMRAYLQDGDLGWFAHTLEEARRGLREAHRRYCAGDWNVGPAPAASFSAEDLARAFAGELDRLGRVPVRLTEQRTGD
jgi:glycosyltransferase involved in cell wall biosynthesis